MLSAGLRISSAFTPLFRIIYKGSQHNSSPYGRRSSLAHRLARFEHVRNIIISQICETAHEIDQPVAFADAKVAALNCGGRAHGDLRRQHANAK
jgi:hypothetical protein